MEKYGLRAAIALVVANMIGVGVFTSLGYQLPAVSDYKSILLLWVLGGAIALMGSYCYSELSAAFPGSGGEYHFLQLSFGKFLGFLSGAVSATVGFAAPVAAAAFAFADYFQDVVPLPLSSSVLGSLLVILVTVVHTLRKSVGARFQVFFTSGKVLLMLGLIIGGMCLRMDLPLSLHTGYLPRGSVQQDLLGGGFWVSLIFVSYAYSGWNATAYITDEVKNAKQNVPRSILTGTLLVLFLYTTIHLVFLLAAPAASMVGKKDIAFVAATYLIGPAGAAVIAALIAFFLVSTVSSMIVVGPRVLQRISSDVGAFRFFAALNRHDVPVRAILFQSSLAILFLMTSQFDWIITSIGFVLMLFNTLTVVSLMLLRYRYPKVERRVKVPLYPVLPLLFISFNLWVMAYLMVYRTQEVLQGVIIVAFCAIIYGILFLTNRKKRVRHPS